MTIEGREASTDGRRSQVLDCTPGVRVLGDPRQASESQGSVEGWWRGGDHPTEHNRALDWSTDIPIIDAKNNKKVVHIQAKEGQEVSFFPSLIPLLSKFKMPGNANIKSYFNKIIYLHI